MRSWRALRLCEKNILHMKNINILWADDEIDLLKPHILFLQEKGFNVETANNGDAAIELVNSQNFDIIFLDENMPGLTGLETLNEIKNISPDIPVIMITKSEAENLMDAAIGSKISDYLIKPVNPNQILLTIKKNIDHKRLITEKTTSTYQSEFQKLGMLINESLTYDDWIDIYKKLVYWELELEASNDNTMDEVLKLQKTEANIAFSKFIKANYFLWFDKNLDQRPLLSQNIFINKVFPLLSDNQKVFVILIDNLRYDQLKIIQPVIREYFNFDDEDIFYSILPTSTQYSRNAIFAGLMPSEIEKIYPHLWLNDEEEGGKNLNEEELLKNQISRLGKNYTLYYEKVTNINTGKKIVENISNILNNQLCVIVYNFIDMLSHARTEMEVVRELANDESAYRSLTLSWFQHSPLLDFLKKLSQIKTKEMKIVITTDHGTIRVSNPVKIIGDRKTTANLRYKQGKNLNYNPKQVFEITQPEKAYLPYSHISSGYVFATNEDFFVYPQNYNYYVNYYKNTFQHGGISMEEILIPVMTLSNKS